LTRSSLLNAHGRVSEPYGEVGSNMAAQPDPPDDYRQPELRKHPREVKSQAKWHCAAKRTHRGGRCAVGAGQVEGTAMTTLAGMAEHHTWHSTANGAVLQPS
jgi:hypothetical protein